MCLGKHTPTLSLYSIQRFHNFTVSPHETLLGRPLYSWRLHRHLLFWHALDFAWQPTGAVAWGRDYFKMPSHRFGVFFCNLRSKNTFQEYPHSCRQGLKVQFKMHHELDLHLLVWLSWDAFLCPSMFQHGKAKARTYIVNVSQLQTKASTTDSRNNTDWVWHSMKRKNWGEGGSQRMTDVRAGQRQRDQQESQEDVSSSLDPSELSYKWG